MFQHYLFFFVTEFLSLNICYARFLYFILFISKWLVQHCRVFIMMSYFIIVSKKLSFFSRCVLFQQEATTVSRVLRLSRLSILCFQFACC